MAVGCSLYGRIQTDFGVSREDRAARSNLVLPKPTADLETAKADRKRAWYAILTDVFPEEIV